ncbi:Uncharacterised protein [Mycobacteroides abscessus subsp. abscessus]|nr:Uncharacterised protein [Mycobacteroides abscessus subsp. abscessus]
MSPFDASLTTTSSGPFTPSPKPRSRSLVAAYSLSPVESMPSCMLDIGIAAMPSSTRPTSATGSGNRVMKRATRRPLDGFESGSSP